MLLATGCQIAQPAFINQAGNAGAALAAASTTLSYAHTGKITFAYARASFVNYQSELADLDQTLPQQQGPPDKQTLQHLLSLYHPAMQVMNQPCLDTMCNWRTQVATLNRASKAFLQAGGQ